MATQSPFSLVEDFLQKFNPGLTPPAWMVHEVQHRLVLLLNHVLMREKEATARLTRQKGRSALIRWQQFELCFVVTPAGLLDLAPLDMAPSLTLAVTDSSPVVLAKALLAGNKPAIRVEGDVQLAAEVNWLVDHVRWDIEEDLARIVGDVPAHTLGQLARGAVGAVRQFLVARGVRPTGGASA